MLIYFAGHGVTEKLHDGKVEGYILPVDADVRDLYSAALSMKEIRELSARIPARHVLYALVCVKNDRPFGLFFVLVIGIVFGTILG